MNWYEYFDNQFELVQGTKGWWRMIDPFDPKALVKRDRTLAVHFEMNQVMGFRSGYRASIETFLVELYQTTYQEIGKLKKIQGDTEPPIIKPRRIESIKSLELPTGTIPILEGDSAIGQAARSYMSNRGFDLYYLTSKGIGYIGSGPFTGFICLPCYENGKLVFYVLRDYLGRTVRYHNPPYDATIKSAGQVVYNSDALNLYEEIFITEGIIDALTVGPTCTATIGKEITLDQKSIYIKGKAKSYIVLSDPGAYARNRIQFATIAQYKKVKIVDLTILGGDVNKVGLELVLDLVHDTPYYNPLDLFNQKLF